jgi:predicted transcriptional regulator
MVVSIKLSAELERKLADRARASGQDASQYVQRLLERDLSAASLDEVLAPLRDEIQRSGITDEEWMKWSSRLRKPVSAHVRPGSPNLSPV